MNETARARESLEAIIDSSKQVEQQIQLIATAATEQTAASGEISESAGHISQLATENTQGAEEAVEALKNLASLANDLDGVISQFQLESSEPSGGSVRGQSRSPARLATRSTPVLHTAVAYYQSVSFLSIFLDCRRSPRSPAHFFGNFLEPR